MSTRVSVAAEAGLLSITLDRPEAINALSLDMIEAIDRALDVADDSITAVALDGIGERGFCAGGDVRQLWADVSAADLDAPRRYFHAEYALNARIAEFPKLIVAFMHGATMGGGVGLAGHSGLRIVGESSKVAMPETKIGFTPDVGGSWLLGRAPGRLGERLGLHGQVMGAAEAIEAGFADCFVPEAHWPAVRQTLAEAAATGAGQIELTRALSAYAQVPAPANFGLPRELIDEVYALPTASDIITALDEADPAGAAELRALSPTALEVTLRSIRSARELTLREALEQEQRLAEWFFTQAGDTIEGIRALLVDKDKAPRWQALRADLPI